MNAAHQVPRNNPRPSAWHGVAPAHWTPTKLKYVLHENRNSSTGLFPPGAISFGQVVQKEMLNSDTLASYQDVKAGEFLVNPINLNYDLKSLRVALSKIDVRVSPAYIVLKHVKGNEPRYLRWLLYLFDVAHMKTLGAGVRQTISFGDMGNCVAFLPPLREQADIANFLDEQTARIDSLIAAKTLLVEKLRAFQYSRSSHLMTRGLIDGAPLTQSGFPEVGAVPSHWMVKRLKFLGDVRSGVAKGKDLGDKDTVLLPYLRVANVQDGYVDLNEVSEIEIATSDATRYLLCKGDVLMNEGGDNDKLGRGAVWQGQIEPCIHQNHVFAVRLQNPDDADWVSRFTSTAAARAYFFLRSKQSTNLASINQSNVRELPVPMPPDDERAAILAEVVRMSKATSDLVDHAIGHIERLREYRSSLISAAVTGQLDINSYKEAA